MSEVDDLERLAVRLERAMRRVDLGAPRSFPLDKRASFVLKRVGVGGLATFEKPMSVRRAIRAIENYRG